MESKPRGVTIPILVQQVRNTAPFLWSDESYSALPFVKTLLTASETPETPLSHSEYFEHCLSAHWATVATNVPTDVDNQIRFRLWHPTLNAEELLLMVGTTLEAKQWDIRRVSGRRVKGSHGTLSGHNGEWFSVAVGALRATEKKLPPVAAQILSLIGDEISRHEKIFEDAFRSGNGIETLKVATILAHNFGDLKRVMDLWKTPDSHPLSQMHENALKSESLTQASELNRLHTADENHRHFALRKPKCLRRFPELMVPIGPFFDDWGKQIASHPEMGSREIGEIIEALIDGWDYLEGSLSYARALAGMESVLGLSRMAESLPVKVANRLKTGHLRRQCSVDQSRFEAAYLKLPYRYSTNKAVLASRSRNDSRGENFLRPSP